MILSNLREKLNRAEYMSDDSTLRACGIWNDYRANRTAFDQFASSVYSMLCDSQRQVAQKSGSRTVIPPTLADCQDYCEKSIDRLPIYRRLRIKSSLNPSEKQECYTALARYLVENSWNSIISQNPCL
jgi:hypothetical protein